MIGRGGRDRYRRDYSPRFEEKGHYGRSNNPPSRNLWVGNLSHHITETTLSEHFLRFGELDSIAFQPGRSYAFVNFRKEEDAIIALRGLQGFVVAGMPLKIEFAKAERPSASSHDEDYLQRRDERRFTERGTPFFQRESRTRQASPEQFYPDKSRMGNKNAEPSEVLWIGFPAFLNVDEMVLRNAFSPFGEVEKITVFPGRSYAFVRFRSVVAACRAKEALQGKLFNNPRVSICFAKSETGPSDHERNTVNAPFSPHFKSNGRPGRSTENIRQDKNFGSSTGDPTMRSPHFNSNLESRDSGVIGFGRNNSLETGGSGIFEQMRFQELGSEGGPSEDIFERQNSPARERGSKRLPRKSPLYENPWDFPDDAFLFREGKKLKTVSFPPDKELPEYPFADAEQDKQHIRLPRIFPDLPEHETSNKNFEAGNFGYNRRIPDRSMNTAHPHGKRDDPWKASYDNFVTGSGSLPTNPVKLDRFNPESHQSPLNEEWKWEGTIAKGGTPVCRARCFPVGKVLDVMLPEFLNCTARTGLDMLAKHYYQAVGAWVVFFVPESDADIGFYNEFMNYLGEKQRAAVAKLGEKTTLFLVPPSDFSEKVLKVPGKMSISGVILRFQHPSSDFGSLHHPLETIDAKFPSFHDDIPYPMPASPEFRLSAGGQTQSNTNSSSEPFPSMNSFSNLRKSGISDLPYLGNMFGSASDTPFPGSAHAMGKVPDSFNENRHDPLLHQRNPTLPPNWSPHQLRSSNPSSGNLTSQASNHAGIRSDDPIAQEYLSVKPRTVQETSSSHYTPGMSLNHYTPGISGIPSSGSSKFSQQETKPPVSLPPPISSLQPEQLAQLASLLGQQQQSGSGPVLSPGEDRKQSNLMNQSEHPFRSSQKYTSQNQASSSDFSTLPFSQVHQLQQQTSNFPAGPQTTYTDLQPGRPEFQGNQTLQNTGAQEETEADTQKRLQATLQLAAALLQQIQQQGKGVDQR
ncbi:hypothetical protein HHK36_003448 [Tetracentron sinense]|uniref:RRM domain-containing protein n=1 Tax=Tetracentron sinense TaxID=13715 RepID=A0A835DPC3_TETSI|nr:hypothetical protein HHK36_003448 [Tetracentron sinense]